ncbi:MAG: hypothetical protein Q9194_006242 [Teloschistes cf. exilis]
MGALRKGVDQTMSSLKTAQLRSALSSRSRAEKEIDSGAPGLGLCAMGMCVLGNVIYALEQAKRKKMTAHTGTQFLAGDGILPNPAMSKKDLERHRYARW